MAKTKTVWSCIECGHTQAKWCGQCPQCSKWNTLQEEVDAKTVPSRYTVKLPSQKKPVRINQVSVQKTPRIPSKIGEFDRLLGGGIVPGSLTLVGGEPGIGKSTLLLQLSEKLAMQGLTILYVCGEESVEQTSLRAKRLGVQSSNLFLLSETEFSAICSHIDQVNPDLIIIDSIQIVYKGDIASAPGSVTQIRETTSEWMHLAKGRNIAMLLIGHVTKSGEIAGPKLLEHLVDTVLYFEGDKQHNFRMIRVVKNRFGPTDEIAVFQMQSEGLIEVPNPSSLFLEERRRDLVGSVIIPTIEGVRPILVEVQSLVTDTAFSTPSRRSTGIDGKRLALLLAVLEKRVGYPLHKCDVFVSVAGGLHIAEPAIDLGIIVSVASSLQNRSIDPDTTVLGEVGLGGEIRGIPRLESRLKEAIHMGFGKCIVPKQNIKGVSASIQKKMTLIPVEMVDEAIRILIS